jgi:hypothetical protein
METEDSLSFSQEPADGPYPNSDESCPHRHTLFLYHHNHHHHHHHHHHRLFKDYASGPVPGQNLFSGTYESIGQLVGLLGQGICPTQGLYLHTGQQNTEKRAHIHPCFE